MRALLSTLILSLTFSLTTFAAGINFSDLSVKKAMKLAAEQDKLIFIDAYTTWCGPCKMMDRETFKDPEVGAYFNEHFISLKIDMESPKAVSMPHASAVRSYPAFLFLNSKGELVHQSGGYQPAFAFLGQGRQALQGAERFKMEERYKDGERSIDFMFHYISEQKNSVRKKKIEKLVHETLAANKEEWQNPYLIGLMFYLPDSPDSEVGQFLASHHEEAVGVAGWNTYMSNMQERFLAFSGVDPSKPKSEWPSVNKMNALFEKHVPDLAARFGSYYEMLIAMRNQDLSLIKNLDQNYLLKYKSDDGYAHQNFAEFLYEKSDDNEILELARRHVLAAIRVNPKSMNSFMTLSAIYTKLGEHEKAEKAKARGIQLGNSSGLEIGK